MPTEEKPPDQVPGSPPAPPADAARAPGGWASRTIPRRFAQSSPLRGRTIVITRAEEKGVVLKTMFEELGARVLAVPCIRFGPPEDEGPLVAAVQALERYTWILFTSSTAVERFFAVAREQRLPAEVWGRFRFGCVGPTTGSQLASAGIQAERVSIAATAAGLAHALLGPRSPCRVQPSDRCLLPQADIARTDVQDALAQAGVTVDTVVAYRTLPEPREKAAPMLKALAAGQAIDAIAFASPSAFENLLAMTAPEGEAAIRAHGIPLFAIGPTTTYAITQRLLPVAGEASPHTSKGLFHVVLRHLVPGFALEEEPPPPAEPADAAAVLPKPEPESG